VTGPLADSHERGRIREELELDRTLIVEAAAGTGKTNELVRRMVAVLKSGRGRLAQMIALTFGESAAGEIKLRLRESIERERLDSKTPVEARILLAKALRELEEARIGTIHAFCADLLREFPVEAGVDPQFEVAAEDESAALRDQAFDRWFEKRLENPGEGIRRILRRPSPEFSDNAPRKFRSGPRSVLRNAFEYLAERRDFTSPWRRNEGFDREGAMEEILAEMRLLGEAAAAGDQRDYFTKCLVEISRFVSEVDRREAVRGRDWDGLEAELIALTRVSGRIHWKWKGFRKFREGYSREDLLARRDTLFIRLKAFNAAAGADIAPRLRDELWEAITTYEDLKARAGRLDYLDLLLRARDLVRGSERVRRDLQQRFSHIFVDEFQDVDPLQAEILLLLSSRDVKETDWRAARLITGKLFIVGDPKQAIYRFRRADPELYAEIKRKLLAEGAGLVRLSVSFRSVPSLQEAVNAAFASLMPGASASQASYVPFDPYREEHGGQPTLVALPVPRPYGDFGIVGWRIEESLPDAVAAFAHWLLEESGWTVTERENPGTRVPIAPRHVCLLFRRFRASGRDVTRDYVRALEARRLPHLLVGGLAFHSREEVEAIRNALLAIERPGDELSVFATLRGPLFALEDGQLLAYRERAGGLHPFGRMPEETPEKLAEVAAALSVLRDLNRGRNERPFADTIAQLLEATRAHAGFAIWPTGEQALANVSRLLDFARRAERGGVVSFQGFVRRLLELAERGEASDAPVLEEGTEGIRIMTAHRAKGLEFPVVILADMTANETAGEPSRWVDASRGLCAMRLAGCIPPELAEHAQEEMEHEREEAVRLLYVAATRARDLLVVPTVGDARQEGWLSALNPVVYPKAASCRSPEDRQPPGCPAFGEESVLRPADVAVPIDSVSPGLHCSQAGSHRVVWWDPMALKLGVQESVGLRQEKLLTADESGDRSQEGIRTHAHWREERERVRESGGAPSLRVITATERAAAEAAAARSGGAASSGGTAAEVVVESIVAARFRPGGRRFGTLIHAVLADLDLRAGKDEVPSAAALCARSLGATQEEAKAASEAVTEILKHPLIRRAAAAEREGRCRREAPITVRLEDGTLMEGLVDAAFLEEEFEGTERGWTVVDFKTDAEIGGRLEEYRHQVALYARGVAEASGAPARGVILRV